MASDIEKMKLAKLKAICENPVLWAKAFLRTVDNATKKIGPWTARWYQAEMLMSDAEKKVARCGRRCGKTETMVVQALWETCTHRSFVSLFAAPYEAQIRMIFNRITEIINLSPAVKEQVISNTKTPFEIKFKNGSAIRGFTTGASSGGGAQSLRGQRSDSIYIDESDYLADADFDSILAIAGEREGIKVFLSSTPTGARKRFWQCCTDPKMHFKQFHFPSTCNPQWGPKMEEEFRAQLSEQGYIHEILAEFGTQETGVFDKDKLDAAMRVDMYAYAPLTYSQKMNVEQNHIDVDMMIPPKGTNLGVYRPNVFRTLGIDWDKYQSSSSLLVLDYLPARHMFKVVRRVEVPRAEYSFDAAVNLVIALNDRYNPSFIYADRGSGEYQIEMLHKYGDMHPETGLKNKVKGFQFAQKIDVMDPVTHMMDSKPMKPFMVNQLAMCIERQQLILSPYDETLHKQLVDYEVIRQSANGQPVFTDVNEHFVDALGLAFLAFVLEFPDLTKTIVDVDFTASAVAMSNPLKERSQKALSEAKMGFGAAKNPWAGLKNGSVSYADAQDPREHDKPSQFRIASARMCLQRHSSWGSRGGGFTGRRRF